MRNNQNLLAVDGLKKVGELVKKFSLDGGWRMSVTIEYLDCRRYSENDRFWIIDSSKPNQQDIEDALGKKVVIPGYRLAQNIRPDDLIMRTFLYNKGLPVVTLEDANLVPEGPVNNTGFLGIVDSIKDGDPKLAFDKTALVRDDGHFYQWDLGKIYEYYKQKSEPLELSAFFEVVRKLENYQSLLTVKQLDQQLKTDIEGTYKELEKVREKLRQKILEYHNDKKTYYTISQTDVPEPPMLSYFDSIKLTENGYEVRTQMAPLFFRSAIRNFNRAKDAKDRLRYKHNDYDALLDELEYSAMCIISAANCLESYINYVIIKCFPNESKTLTSITPGKKWILVTVALNLSFRFKSGKPPYGNFSRLIKLRNDIIHHKAEYDSADGEIGHTYNQLNIKNAEFAIKVVRDMVTELSKDGKIPLPRWIKTHDASAAYWDEVSEYLKKM